MRKKVLVITLALVLALASSAMAAVDFSGSLKFEFSQDHFKFFQEEYKLKYTPTINIKMSNKNEAGGRTNWTVEGEVGKTLAEVTKYKVTLNDDHFDAVIWGKGARHVTKATSFGFVAADRDEDDHRVRVTVPVMDLATITTDVKNNQLAVFAEGDVEGYALGFAYQRLNWADATNIIVGQVSGDIPAGDLDLGFEAAIGASLGDDTGLAFGVSLDADITDEISVSASVKNANEHWAGKGATPKNTVIGFDAGYTEANIAVSADLTHTMVKDGDSTTDLGFDAKYRMGTLAYRQLFHQDHWFKNDAPAFGANLDFSGLEFGGITLNATAPVVDDMVWVWANAKYVDKDTITAYVLGRVLATDKLTLKPRVDYTHKGTLVDVKLDADYKIGASSTILAFGIQKVFAKDPDDQKESVTASITIPF